MKILMFGMSSFPGGIENYIKNIFFDDEFAKKHTIDFVVYDGAIAFKEEIQKYGYGVFYAPHQKKKPLAYSRWKKRFQNVCLW